jgi:protein-tyrosine phosphatase
MPVKIVMVCLGNICRSPLAEGILASKLPKDKYIVDSAGTSSWHVGDKPDLRSIATAKKRGIDISNQKGKQFTSNFFDEFDYIYVMDESNYRNVISLSSSQKHKEKVNLILDVFSNKKLVEVPDPYYGLQDGFDAVYEMLDKATDIIAQNLIAKHS